MCVLVFAALLPDAEGDVAVVQRTRHCVGWGPCGVGKKSAPKKEGGVVTVVSKNYRIYDGLLKGFGAQKRTDGRTDGWGGGGKR